MFYVKMEFNDLSVKADITDENVYTICPVCGKEHQVDLQELLTTGEADLYSTSVFCKECSEKHISEKR
jgi:transcription elongation factor Elf1